MPVGSSSSETEVSNLDGHDFGCRATSRLVENYRQCGNSENLNEAIRVLEQTLDMGMSKFQPVVLGNLGVVLFKRFERTGSRDDLDRAIDAMRLAIDATSEGDSDQAFFLSKLSTFLRARSERTALHRRIGASGKSVDNEDEERLLVVEAPEGETIYANTPQHHSTVLLLQMSDRSGNESSPGAKPEIIEVQLSV